MLNLLYIFFSAFLLLLKKLPKLILGIPGHLNFKEYIRKVRVNVLPTWLHLCHCLLRFVFKTFFTFFSLGWSHCGQTSRCIDGVVNGQRRNLLCISISDQLSRDQHRCQYLLHVRLSPDHQRYHGSYWGRVPSVQVALLYLFWWRHRNTGNQPTQAMLCTLQTVPASGSPFYVWRCLWAHFTENSRNFQ